MNIYNILSQKLHNKHYLIRYIKFIEYCKSVNSVKTKSQLGYCEQHHICPKAKDLFPEYSSFKLNPWNKIVLTTRQHFIAHFMLYKCYGKSQSLSFYSLCHQKSKYQNKRYTKINSKTYSKLKENQSSIISKHNKNKASYKDEQDNTIHCRTDDPRVLSGELIPLSKGRKYKWNISDERRRNNSYNMSKRMWNDKFINLYFLETKISIKVTFGMPEIILYIDQGWSLRRTKEHHSLTAAESNRKRSKKEKNSHNSLLPTNTL